MKTNIYVALFLALGLMMFAGNATATTSATLTIATYNIHSAIPDGFSNATYQPTPQDLHNVSDVLTTMAADIVALQEVRNQWTRPSRNKKAGCLLNMPLYLGGLLNMNYAYGSTLDSVSGYPENRDYVEWGNLDKWTNNGKSHGEYGNAILSRLELKGPPEIIKLPRGDAKVTKKSDEPRNAVRVELAESIPGLGRVVVYGTHFQHNNGKTRKAQMTELLREAKVDADNGASVFLMGDMNHYPHPGEPDLLAMVKDAGFYDLAAQFAKQSGTEPHHTIGKNDRKRRIDYIFCNRQLKLINVEVLVTPVSDHLPLSATIDLQ